MRLISIALFASLCSPASSQGETCATPTILPSTGTFAFDTSTLDPGSSGIQFPDCQPWTQGGHAPAHYVRDGFFLWTVPSNGDYYLQISATWNAYMSLYSGNDCNAPCLGFFPDLPYPKWTFRDAIAGEQILIQIGSQYEWDSGAATMTITEMVCPTSPTDALEDNDDCSSAAQVTSGLHTNLAVSPDDHDYYKVDIPSGHRLDVLLQNSTSSLRAARVNPSCVTSSGNQSLVVLNQTHATITQIFRVHNHSTQGTGSCGVYDMQVDISYDPCSLVWEDALGGNDTCAEAASISAGTYPDMYLSSAANEFYRVNVRAGGTIHWESTYDPNGHGTTVRILYPLGTPCSGWNPNSLDYSSSLSGTDTVSWTNQSGVDEEVLIWVFLDWNTNATNEMPYCLRYDMRLWGDYGWPGDVGTTFCDPMLPNSIGLSTRLYAMQSAAGGANVRLESSAGPPGQFASLLVGTAPETVAPLMLGNGLFCLSVNAGNIFGRYNIAGGSQNSIGIYDTNGEYQNLVGTSTTGPGFDLPDYLPYGGGSTVMLTGGSHYFQLWHREPNGGSNFSNGVEVSFP